MGAQCLDERKKGAEREKGAKELGSLEEGYLLCSVISSPTAVNTTGAFPPTVPTSHPTEEQFDSEQTKHKQPGGGGKDHPAPNRSF